MFIKIDKIKKGMKIKNAVTKGSNIILDRGATLTEEMIAKLNKFSISEVDIISEEDLKAEKLTPERREEEKNKKKIKQTYQKNIEGTQIAFDSILSGVGGKEETEIIINETIDQLDLDKDIFIGLLESTGSDNYLFEHTMNSTVFALAIGKELDYDDEKLKKLGKAAFLHDIGMFKIDEKILKKDKITEEEREQIKKHPLYAKEMLKDFDQDIIDAALCHHERIDGKGYPRGLKNEEISEMAKIVSVADEFSAMISKRSYREEMTNYDAIKKVMESTKDVLDSAIVKKLISGVSIYPIKSKVLLNDGRKGIVVRSTEHPFRPIIDILDSGERIDLTDTTKARFYITGEVK